MKVIRKYIKSFFSLFLIFSMSFLFCQTSSFTDLPQSFSEQNESKNSDADSDEKIVTKAGCVFGVSSIPFGALKGIVDRDNRNDVAVNFYRNQESLITDFLKGNLDLCLLPFEPAMKVVEYFPEQIVCGGVTQRSNAFLLCADGAISSYSELLGKTVYLPKEDKMTCALFKWVLSQYGIPVNKGPRGVTVNDLDTSVQIVPEISSRAIKFAVLSEPYASLACLKNRKLVRSVDYQKQLDSIVGSYSYYPETVLLVKRDFSKTSEYASFEELFHFVVEYSLKNPKKVAEWNYRYNLFGSELVTELAYYKLNFCFENSESVFDDFQLGVKILMPDCKFCANLNKSNFCLFE